MHIEVNKDILSGCILADGGGDFIDLNTARFKGFFHIPNMRQEQVEFESQNFISTRIKQKEVSLHLLILPYIGVDLFLDLIDMLISKFRILGRRCS